MMNKGIGISTTTEAIRVLHKNGIFTHGGFVVGTPYETKEQINRTVMFADQLRTLGMDSLQFSIYTPFPGTDIFKKALGNDGLLTFDWNLYDCFNPTLKTNLSPLWIYLKANLSEYLFFLKKGISHTIARKDNALQENVKYAKLVQNNTRFLSRNLFGYAEGLIMLPMDALKVWSKLRRTEKPGKQEREEILNLTCNLEKDML
jgi:anaerobic magnesium-protoporphyrin IX monomethyl ester cyclase